MRKYTEIQGWFDFETLYNKWVKECTNDDVIIEIGAWRGKSFSYLREQLFIAGKQPAIIAVDKWNYKDINKELEGHDGDLFQEFIDNMEGGEPFGANYLTLQTASKTCMFNPLITELIKNKRTFVMLDGDHTYQAVYDDTYNILRVLKKGDVVAWHDFERHEVRSAVFDAFENAISNNQIEQSFIININELPPRTAYVQL